MTSAPSLADFKPQRILILQLRQIGDVLLSTPAVRALRKKFPDARIDMLVESGPSGVLIGNPHIDNIIIRNPKRGALESLRNILEVRANRYDLVIDLLANPRTALIARLSGAKATLSYAGNKRSGAYKYTVGQTGKYSAGQKLSILRALGIEGGDLRPVFCVSENARLKIDKWLSENKIAKKSYVVIDSTHRRETRLWKKFGEFADELKRKSGLTCVFIWGPGEEEYIDKALAACREKHLKGPPPSFDTLGALLELACALIGTCSAPAHIAAAVGTPTLQVIGSSHPENWVLPEPIHGFVMLGLDCQPCGSNKCARNDIACMEQLTAETVVAAFETLMKSVKK